MSKSYQMDMSNGPLFTKLLIFSFPLMLSGILQLLFNAADIIVVGRFSGSHALAAVGSTSSLINLLVNLFIGVSVGANVLLGRYLGSNDYENAQKSVKTAMTLAVISGFIMAILGNIGAEYFLELMQTPSDVIDLSTVYIRIYFLGMPFFMVYNFGAALLRAIGDTKRPLYFLLVAGIINVLFNLLFVIVFKLGVAGVALATIISQGISAGFILMSLYHSEDYLHFDIRKLSFDGDKFIQMLKIGLPAGLQGVVFNISNVLIQSSVNSFGSTVMAGNTAANNIEGFVYTSMNAVYQTSLSFTSRNYGARKIKRIDKILIECLLIVTVVGLVMGIGAYAFGNTLLGIYSSNPKVIAYGMNRLGVVSVTYCLCGIMDVIVGSLRGMGNSFVPMIVSLLGACLFRVIWIFTIFQIQHTQFILYVSYPISWIITASVHLITFYFTRKKVMKKFSLESKEA